jgi:hypothetical protein
LIQTICKAFNPTGKTNVVSVHTGQWTDGEDGQWIDFKFRKPGSDKVFTVHLYFKDSGEALTEIKVFETEMIEEDSSPKFLF